MDKDFYNYFLRKIFVKIFVVCKGLQAANEASKTEALDLCQRRQY